MQSQTFVGKNIECRLCLKRSEDAISFFLENVIELIEELTDLKLNGDEGPQSSCCLTCFSDLQKACDLKARLLKWYKNSLMELQVDVASNDNTAETESNSCEDDLKEDISDVLESKEPPTSEQPVTLTKRNKRLTKYVIKKSKPEIFLCSHCEMSFEDRRSFNAHMGKHKCKTCTICGASIRSDNFKKHFDSHSANPEVCEICGAVAKNKESLRGHMFHQHKRSADSYKCELCDSRFRYKYKYTLHIQKIHIGERNHQCEVCGKKFFTLADIRKHKNMTHLRLRPYICTYCFKAFSSKYALKTHVRQHTQETPFRCDICAEGFRQKVSLKTHLKSKHNIVVVHMPNNKNMERTADDITRSDNVDTKNGKVQEEC